MKEEKAPKPERKKYVKPVVRKGRKLSEVTGYLPPVSPGLPVD